MYLYIINGEYEIFSQTVVPVIFLIQVWLNIHNGEG